MSRPTVPKRLFLTLTLLFLFYVFESTTNCLCTDLNYFLYFKLFSEFQQIFFNLHCLFTFFCCYLPRYLHVTIVRAYLHTSYLALQLSGKVKEQVGRLFLQLFILIEIFQNAFRIKLKPYQLTYSENRVAFYYLHSSFVPNSAAIRLRQFMCLVLYLILIPYLFHNGL